MKRPTNVSAPCDLIHDITHSYGRILFPCWYSKTVGVRWLMRSERGYFALTTRYHNCTVTRVR